MTKRAKKGSIYSRTNVVSCRVNDPELEALKKAMDDIGLQSMNEFVYKSVMANVEEVEYERV